ncbi:MAG: leucyl aminopeptidase family protein, partial [Bdellovibrionales bacterium]|nr:leucyl aminopeptidase family protein [Bdellovibrionales bacterium]
SQQAIILAGWTNQQESGKGKKKKQVFSPVISHWPKEIQTLFKGVATHQQFTGEMGQSLSMTDSRGRHIIAIGMGLRGKCTFEMLRKEGAKLYNALSSQAEKLSIDFDSFVIKNRRDDSLAMLLEGIGMAAYRFNKYKAKAKPPLLTTIYIDSFNPKITKANINSMANTLERTQMIVAAISMTRDLVNEVPNVLNSVTFAKKVDEDIKSLKKGVKVKILDKKGVIKEKMGLFLAVNAGSSHEPRLVHLSYTPKKVTKNTKHIVLVGKGLTFDAGGYSLKPSASMMNMKFDMAGAATVYGAFRAAVQLGVNAKVSCILGMTDNVISNQATLPDSIIKSRNGKTVEILNTDAEGRLVLADLLDYASDLRPDSIIDAATLTGAILVALGGEVCGLFGNNDKLNKQLLSSANSVSEYLWQLPVIDEFCDEIKSNIADLKNMGNSRFGGSGKAAAFLQQFVGNDIPWAHLDIAGIGDSQGHLPYCPKKGSSGLMVRTLVDYLDNV